MKKHNFSAIILAAGEGKRMKSEKSKVLHKIGGKPMIQRTCDILEQVSLQEIIIVASSQNLVAVKREITHKVKYAVQKAALGTADAALSGLKIVRKDIPTIAVMYGDDSAFYRPETILKVFKRHQNSAATLTFVTVKKANPSGFGRVIRKSGKVLAIIEEKDASAAQKRINEVNASLYFFNKNWLLQNLTKVKPSPVTGELYITDLIAIARENNQKVQAVLLEDEEEWQSVNTKKELLAANLKFQKRIHIMGIAGAGASAIAGIARALGYSVDGCDLEPESPYAKNLENIKIAKDHQKSHLKNIGMLILSPSVLKFDPENREVLDAKRQGIPTLTWQEFQGKFLQKNKFVIAVAGAYGKSTTTAMISQILIDQKLDPTCEIGAKVLAWGQNFRLGKSKYYVCEADEYNDNFLNYLADIAVVLNLGWDHPDYFKSQKDVFASYKNFIAKIKKGGFLIIGKDSKLQGLAEHVPKGVEVVKVGDFGDLNLALIGDFRGENARAALTVAGLLKLDLSRAKKTVEQFEGVSRRLEYKGQINGVKVYDDYAVQPYTILKTINALKEKFPRKKLAVIFEPHTFSRIKFFFNDFVKSLKNSKSDYIFISDVYAAREEGDEKELARRLADSVGKKAKYLGDLENCAQYAKGHLSEIDVILSMGAGRSYKIWDFLNSN